MTDNPWSPELQTAHREQTRKIIDKFKKAFNEPEPKILYHYSKTDNLHSILESKFFRASNITKLNDLSEYKYGLSLAKKLILKRNYDSEFTHLLLTEIDNYIDFSPNIFVLSLSRNGDSLPLWQSYSEADFTGYNLGFYYQDLNLLDSRCHGNVIYSNAEQERILYELVDEFADYYQTTIEMANPLSLNFINAWHWEELINYFTLFKHSAFKCEEEYRVVYYIDPSREYLIRGKESDKPYIEIPFCYYDEERCNLTVWEIGIGPKNMISNNEVKSVFPQGKLIDADINRSDIPLK